MCWTISIMNFGRNDLGLRHIGAITVGSAQPTPDFAIWNPAGTPLPMLAS